MIHTNSIIKMISSKQVSTHDFLILVNITVKKKLLTKNVDIFTLAHSHTLLRLQKQTQTNLEDMNEWIRLILDFISCGSSHKRFCGLSEKNVFLKYETMYFWFIEIIESSTSSVCTLTPLCYLQSNL